MRPATKMLMISSRGPENNDRHNREKHDGSPNRDYGMEDKYRRPENGDNSEMRMGYDAPESRRRYRRYDDGRFAPRNEYGEMNGGYAHYPSPYHMPPPVYEGEDMEGDQSGRMEMNYPRQGDESRPMNRIGFDGDEHRPRMDHDYRQDAEYRRMGEMNHHGGSEQMAGMESSKMLPKFNREMALEWTGSMENSDGTSGPHWSMEQTNRVMSQKGIQCDPLEFWAVMNAIYSDDSAVAKKHNVNTIDYYVDRAKAWLEDKDAVKNKASAYFTYIVKH